MEMVNRRELLKCMLLIPAGLLGLKMESEYKYIGYVDARTMPSARFMKVIDWHTGEEVKHCQWADDRNEIVGITDLKAPSGVRTEKRKIKIIQEEEL